MSLGDSSWGRVIGTCAILLLLSLLNGCSPWSKSKLFDVKSFSRSSPRASSPAEVKVKPLSNNEQRKLCLATAEQLAQSQHWSEAAQLYLKAEALGKPGQALDRELAPVLAANGEYPESIERYRRLLDKNPNDAALEINFAWTLMEAGNLAEAEEHLRNALHREPKHEAARMNLGTLLVKSGRTAEAYDAFQAVVGESAAHHNIGVMMLDLGEKELAKQAFENALACSDCTVQTQQFLAALSKEETTQLR
jgi:tetratricopeptide (TPR) repeat protein